MAPTYFSDQTTCSLYSPGRWTYTSDTVSITPAKHNDITLGWCDNHYFATVTTPSYQKKIKKLLKKMKNEMCRRGWINPTPYYFSPQLKPIELRNVRYDGRGWANSK